MRGRRLTAFLTAGTLALLAAGCGGDDQLAPEVPGPPADVVIPESADAPTSAATNGDEDSADGTGDETTDDEGTTDDSGATTTPEETATPTDQGTVPETGDGGTAAPDAEADSPTNDTEPPAGSNAEQFEDFCAQNPGAC